MEVSRIVLNSRLDPAYFVSNCYNFHQRGALPMAEFVALILGVALIIFFSIGATWRNYERGKRRVEKAKRQAEDEKKRRGSAGSNRGVQRSASENTVRRAVEAARKGE